MGTSPDRQSPPTREQDLEAEIRRIRDQAEDARKSGGGGRGLPRRAGKRGPLRQG